MDIYLTRTFARWRAKERLSDEVLCASIVEMEAGLIDANLGGGLYKKRVAGPGRGKRGSFRTLIAVRFGHRAIFLFGFGKNERAKIDASEERAFKIIARSLLDYDSVQIATAISGGELQRLRCENGEA